jgi:hypothetical protein
MFVGRSARKVASVGNLTHFFVVGSMGGTASKLTHCLVARAETKARCQFLRQCSASTLRLPNPCVTLADRTVVTCPHSREQDVTQDC